jgi:hypothetical protein
MQAVQFFVDDRVFISTGSNFPVLGTDLSHLFAIRASCDDHKNNRLNSGKKTTRAYVRADVSKL